MLERILQTGTFLTAQGALDGYAARHAAIAENIANANTPGYKRKVVAFEQALQEAVQQSISPCTGAAVGPVAPFVPPVSRDTTASVLPDGNNVVLETEMSQLAENALRYDTIALYVGRFFSGLKSVINSK
jgi:flagellar basal-body rod protein FlgB